MNHTILDVIRDYYHRARPFRVLPVRLLYKAGLLRFFNIKLRIKYAGKTFYIPVLGGRGVPLLRMVLHERWLAQVFSNLKVEEPGYFIDVGVNIGQTLIKAKRYFPNLVYVGFEPNPLCAAYVDSLSVINKFENVSVLPCALSDNTECLRFLNKQALVD